MSTRPTKRQRREQPRSLLDNESLACVASPDGPIRTLVVDEVTKEIVLDRLEKEICQRFDLRLSVPRAKRPMVMKDGKMVPVEQKRQRYDTVEDSSKLLLKSRLKIGTNECTRALEAAIAGKGSVPCLIILAKGIHPPHILAHVPYLAKQVGTPVMLLPGKASYEMGKAMGVKTVAILLFLSRPTSNVATNAPTKTKQEQADHDRIDSFVDFVKCKMPKPDT